jgi:UDP-N-acetylglucosamine--dolichyl-phosphate N-acetylglucosaminephosphotransferase
MKVLGSALASLPLLLLGVYVPKPVLPIVGETRLTVVYPLLVLAGIPVAANAVNMIDVVNGVVSSIGVVVGLVIAAFKALEGDMPGAIVGLVVSMSSLGFWLLHRYPSKILPGDSGSLALGAMLASIAFAYRAEMVVIVALLPQALNGFFILSSVKKIVEHREIRSRPTVVRNGLISASCDPKAPITLLRMLATARPITEIEAGRSILVLQLYSGLLALVTGLMVVYS